MIPAAPCPLGRLDSAKKTFPSLFHCDTHRGSECEARHALVQAQGLMALSPVGDIHFLDLAPYPRWNPPRPVDMPIWKDPSFALLVLCNEHIGPAPHVFVSDVCNRDQTNHVSKTPPLNQNKPKHSSKLKPCGLWA